MILRRNGAVRVASRWLLPVVVWWGLVGFASAQADKEKPAKDQPAAAQPAAKPAGAPAQLFQVPGPQPATPEETKAIEEALAALQKTVQDLRAKMATERFVDDVEICAKGAEWILRHQEFYKPEYAKHALSVLELGQKRAAELAEGKSTWEGAEGTRVLAYRSAVDDSLQPYAVTMPKGAYAAEKRIPLHIVLHGRNGFLNEVSFIQSQEGKAIPEGQDWIQLDVFGRTNNSYRWSGETDFFEAFADVRRRFRIDEKRVVLRGFSMGGAGSWHLGLHYPSLWCSVGPGAGYVDFYKFQKVEQELPFYQHAALHIYDAVDYALNAFNVPICTYGGDQDAQLLASTTMDEAAKKLGVPMKLLIGPDTGHSFHPESFKEYMAFHLKNQEQGRIPYPGMRKVRFVTYTPKYNACEWVSVEEMGMMYRPAIVEGEMDEDAGILRIKTENVVIMQLARDLAEKVEIDGVTLDLSNAADGLLPGVYYEGYDGNWHVMSYDSSLNFPKNLDQRKRKNLQGPIDDAFTQPFVCVMGTGKPWSEAHAAWVKWTFDRFSSEFDKWFRGKVPVIKDTEVTPDIMAEKSLILFGDPGSNSTLAQFLPRLPVKWTKDALVVHGKRYDPETRAASFVYINPMNARRYVVVNSGHTFHEPDFKNSNAWLFPRLADIAVQHFEKTDNGYKETVEWADFFNNAWRLPSRLGPPEPEPEEAPAKKGAGAAKEKKSPEKPKAAEKKEPEKKEPENKEPAKKELDKKDGQKENGKTKE